MNDAYSYTIDQSDIIVDVSENWKSFAEQNLGEPKCFPENIVGSSLWEHIYDTETKHLYNIVLQKVREYKHTASLPFRCDSPEKRRFLVLSIIPVAEGRIVFRSQIIREELRESVDLLRHDIERSDDLIRICSMCKKIAVSDTEWEEIEVAAQKMKIFEKGFVPQITHGVCHYCYQVTLEEIERMC